MSISYRRAVISFLGVRIISGPSILPLDVSEAHWYNHKINVDNRVLAAHFPFQKDIVFSVYI